MTSSPAAAAASCHTTTTTDATKIPIYYDIIPDCISVIFSFYLHHVTKSSLVVHNKPNNNNKTAANGTAADAITDTTTNYDNDANRDPDANIIPYHSTSDASFALKWFSNWKFAHGLHIGPFLDPIILKQPHHHRNNNHVPPPPPPPPPPPQLQYLECGCKIRDSEMHLLENLQSLNWPRPIEWTPKACQYLKNLRELRISCDSKMTNEGLQSLESLEILVLDMDYVRNESPSHEGFRNMRHLRELELNRCSIFGDETLETLYKAGSRLEKLRIPQCYNMTNRALSFASGVTELDISKCRFITDEGFKYMGSVRSLRIEGCHQLTGKGFRHLKGLQRLNMSSLHGSKFDCHEAFRHLEGSLEHLDISFCSVESLDDKAFSYLKGIKSLDLSNIRKRGLTDDLFRYVAGSIQNLKLFGCRLFSKKALMHLSGVEELDIEFTRMQIGAEDLPKLKHVLGNVSRLYISSDFADEAVVKELRSFIEGNGGRLYVDWRKPKWKVGW